ncbi:MAG: sugar ABC transporter permease [Lachnospiraceae bacterium]|nr:sugar ABC transporter permease [Lachnospiraceae bacterium]MBR2275329.1 sugar ABC transporter permease [Lachnospiraceae bacterium]
MLNSIRPKGRVIFAYLVIPVVLFIFTVFVPLVAALYYGFTDWKGGPTKNFNGLENYVQLFHDDVFWQSFGNNIYLVVACIIGQIGIAFIIVMLINSKLVKLKGIHRTFGFFPSTISALCVGFVWKMIYDQRTGLINWFLVNVLNKYKNMKSAPIWLSGEVAPIMLVLSIPLIWQYIGYYMVIILSAVASIDTEVLESAEIDGATGVQRARYIVFPLIKNTLLVCITLCIAGNMKAFDSIYAMTEGGPGTSSMVMALYGYNQSFKSSNLGYGSTISVGIFVLSLAVIGGSQLVLNYFMTDKYDREENKLKKQRDKEARIAMKQRAKGGAR